MLQSCFKMTSVNNASRLVYVLASRAYSRKSRRNREIRGEELLEQEDELVMVSFIIFVETVCITYLLNVKNT